MKKIAALIIAALIALSGILYFLNRKETALFVGTFSGQEAHLGNGFFRGFSFYVGEFNKAHTFKKIEISALDHEGRLEGLKNILNKEQPRIDRNPVVLQGSEAFLKPLVAESESVIPGKALLAVSSDSMENRKYSYCVETSFKKTIEDALLFAKNNLKVTPGLVGLGPNHEAATLGGYEDYTQRLSLLDAKSSLSAVVILLPADQILATAMQLRHQGYKGQIIVPSSVALLDMRSQLAAVDGENYLISNYSSAAQEPGLKEFIVSYTELYHEAPSQYAFFGYVCAAKVFQDRKLVPTVWLDTKAFKIEKTGDVAIAITK